MPSELLSSKTFSRFSSVWDAWFGVYIDTEGKIFKIKSVFEPSQFTVLGAAEAEEAGGEEGQEGQEGVAAA